MEPKRLFDLEFRVLFFGRTSAGKFFLWDIEVFEDEAQARQRVVLELSKKLSDVPQKIMLKRALVHTVTDQLIDDVLDEWEYVKRGKFWRQNELPLPF